MAFMRYIDTFFSILSQKCQGCFSVFLNDFFLWVLWMQMHMLIFLCRCRMCAVTFFNKSDMQIHGQVPHGGEAAQVSSLLQILRQLQLPGAAHPHPQRRQNPTTCLPTARKPSDSSATYSSIHWYAWVCDLLKNALLHTCLPGWSQGFERVCLGYVHTWRLFFFIL